MFWIVALFGALVTTATALRSYYEFINQNASHVRIGSTLMLEWQVAHADDDQTLPTDLFLFFKKHLQEEKTSVAYFPFAYNYQLNTTGWKYGRYVFILCSMEDCTSDDGRYPEWGQSVSYMFYHP